MLTLDPSSSPSVSTMSSATVRLGYYGTARRLDSEDELPPAAPLRLYRAGVCTEPCLVSLENAWWVAGLFELFGGPPDRIYISSETCLPSILLKDPKELPLEVAAAPKVERLPTIEEAGRLLEAGYRTQPDEVDELLPSEFSTKVSITIRLAWSCCC